MGKPLYYTRCAVSVDGIRIFQSFCRAVPAQIQITQRRSPTMLAVSRPHKSSYWSMSLLPLFVVLLSMGEQTAAQTFQHPGVLVSKAQLDFIKLQVANKVDPIYTAYQKAVASSYGSLTYAI